MTKLILVTSLLSAFASSAFSITYDNPTDPVIEAGKRSQQQQQRQAQIRILFIPIQQNQPQVQPVQVPMQPVQVQKQVPVKTELNNFAASPGVIYRSGVTETPPKISLNSEQSSPRQFSTQSIPTYKRQPQMPVFKSAKLQPSVTNEESEIKKVSPPVELEKVKAKDAEEPKTISEKVLDIHLTKVASLKHFDQQVKRELKEDYADYFKSVKGVSDHDVIFRMRTEQEDFICVVSYILHGKPHSVLVTKRVSA